MLAENKHDFYFETSIPMVNLKLINNSFDGDYFRRGYGCLGFVLIVNEPCKLFQYIEYKIRHSEERFNNRKYLILPGNEYLEENVMCLFQLEEIEYVADMVIVLPTNEVNDAFQINSTINDVAVLENFVNFELITHKYIGDVHNEMVLLDKWFSRNQSFLYGNNLYPNKLTNQQGRAIRIATFTYPPYAIPGTVHLKQWSQTGSQPAVFGLRSKMCVCVNTMLIIFKNIKIWIELLLNHAI